MSLGNVDDPVAYAALWDDPAPERMWEKDGGEYFSCFRCGINMKVPDATIAAKAEPVFFCQDCNHPDLLAPFRDEWEW